MTSPPNPHTPENWDAASLGYATKVAPAVTVAYADDLIDRLDLGPNTEALEVGAGSGVVSERLAKRVKSLLAVDFAPKMIAILRERMTAVGATNVRCEVMDGQALAIADASFDRAACSFALMLFPDRAKGFSELRRVLRPGGRAVVSGWAGPDKFEALGIFLQAIRAALPDMPPPPAPPPIFSLANPGDFKRQMEAAGFDDVEVEFVSHDVEVASFDDMWEMLTEGAPPVQALLDRIGPTGRDRVRDALRRIFEQRSGGGSIRLSNVATFGRGTVR